MECLSYHVDDSTKVQHQDYLCASNANVSNFVSVKLSSDRNYHIWKTQMLCLMNSHNMGGIVDDTYLSPSYSSTEMNDKYDSLLKGWIFGSASENVLGAVIDLSSAKEVWDKLKSFYDTTISLHQDSALTKSEANTEAKDIDVISAGTNANGKDTAAIEIICNDTAVYTENETKVEETENETLEEKKMQLKKSLRKATMKGDWSKAEDVLKKDKDLVTEAISSDGSTVLHVAVGIGLNDFVKNLVLYINDEEVLHQRNSDGSTALHIAAIVGNKYAAELLVKKNDKLLYIEDHKGHEPLHKAYENMHLDTIGYLLKSVKDDGKTNFRSFSLRGLVNPHLHPGVEIGVGLLVNAISAKEYNLALELAGNFPEFASKGDHVLMAIAKTFPTGLHHWQNLIYPSLDNSRDRIRVIARLLWDLLFILPRSLCSSLYQKHLTYTENICYVIGYVSVSATLLPLSVFVVIIYLLILMVCFSFLVLYFLLWKGAKILFAPIRHIEKKKKEWDEAKKVLELVCDEIDKLKYSGSHHPYYTRPILEAACQNAYAVVDEILFRSPEAIQSTDKSGYDIIQLAVIHRSEKIYNLIYDIGERKNLYRTIVDSSKNNILHLAGRLAPSRELNSRTGAALQLQRELQWRKEVKKLVFPTYITQENIFKETPDMVFTMEHENLVKEGEKWMKATAESCGITAALITTIVFAAAITVPGGSHQETGIPVFREDVAFSIFAVSDAISLFASSTALLVFLSILTARFAEKDFLVSLPRRLLIGLFSLLVSAAAMMVAFSATLFLVFCDKKPWMLAPICGLAFIPIACFVSLQFTLMVDVFHSTQLSLFGKQRKSIIRRFNPDDIRLLFAK